MKEIAKIIKLAMTNGSVQASSIIESFDDSDGCKNVGLFDGWLTMMLVLLKVITTTGSSDELPECSSALSWKKIQFSILQG